jgi:tetraacyldisaccharide 4'-kinase
MRALERLWWTRRARPLDELWLWPLSLASLGYRAAAALDKARARPWRAPVPVISVGNLAVGGTGKTPVALFLCERLLAHGRRPALIARGHGGRAVNGPLWVCRGEGPLVGAREAGDEPVLAAQRLPWLRVLVGRDRAAAARAAVEAGADVLILDDGLQSWRMDRDLDVVVADSRTPLGNGRRLPRGPLREPPSALARVGARGLLWLTGVEPAAAAATDHALQLSLLTTAAADSGLMGPVESRFSLRPPAWTAGSRAVLLAGIARPERFAQAVRAAGAEVVGEHFYADHHRFTAAEIQRAERDARDKGARLVTTEKDRVRLPAGSQAEALPGTLGLSGGETELDGALDRICSLSRADGLALGARPLTAPRGLLARVLFALGSALAGLAWLLRIRRRVVEENQARAFPERSAAERCALARAAYRSLGRTLAEIALARTLSAEALASWVAVDGLEIYQRALAGGRGAVCALAHLGNWELAGLAAARAGIPVTPIVRPLRGRQNRWLVRARGEAGLHSLGDRGVSAEALAALRRNQVLAVAVDQNMLRRRGVFVDFFGTPACTTPAAAVYALRAGSPLIAAFPVRQPDGTHRVRVLGPFEPPAGLRGHAAVLALTQELTRQVEQAVRANPEQWLWLHRRWKTRP